MVRKNASKGPQRSEKTVESIRKKAYEIYEKNGRVPGRDLNNWLEAETIILKITR
ncbi:MAG: DUF2934 domain-containing protein [Candidatus Omnitrophica bacterium]|nr:DUF2934 domain-containing protein [Candidatus Omnitrophota bacterium]